MYMIRGLKSSFTCFKMTNFEKSCIYIINVILPYMSTCSIEYFVYIYVQGGPKKNNTETNQNDTDTNDIFGKTLLHNYL